MDIKTIDKIIELYNDPKFGFVNVDTFRKKLNEKGIKVTREDLKTILSTENSYSLNKAVKKHYSSRKVIVVNVFEQLQADLVHIDNPQGADAKDNDGTKYLLTIIDCFSKYAWVIPLKDKKAEGIVKAFEPIFKEIHPETLQVDKGSEFYNKLFENLLKKYNVKLFSTQSDKKASIIERFNRTLKMKMSKLFDATNSFRYIDALDDLVYNYNHTIHRTIGIAPINAIKLENYDIVYDNFYKNHSFVPEKSNFEVGDIVRIPIYKNIFTKEIVGNWTIELFKVSKINKTNPVTYNVVDLLDDPIKGTFYSEELQKVDKSVLDKPFRIEKVIKTRTKNGVKESFVKYLGYDDRFNEWINTKSIT